MLAIYFQINGPIFPYILSLFHRTNVCDLASSSQVFEINLNILNSNFPSTHFSLRMWGALVSSLIHHRRCRKDVEKKQRNSFKTTVWGLYFVAAENTSLGKDLSSIFTAYRCRMSTDPLTRAYFIIVLFCAFFLHFFFICQQHPASRRAKRQSKKMARICFSLITEKSYIFFHRDSEVEKGRGEGIIIGYVGNVFW